MTRHLTAFYRVHSEPALAEGVHHLTGRIDELGLRRIMFAVEDIDNHVARMLARGAELVGEVVQYGDTYRLAYVRGPEGIVVGLAEELRQ